MKLWDERWGMKGVGGLVLGWAGMWGGKQWDGMGWGGDVESRDSAVVGGVSIVGSWLWWLWAGLWVCWIHVFGWCAWQGLSRVRVLWGDDKCLGWSLLFCSIIFVWGYGRLGSVVCSAGWFCLIDGRQGRWAMGFCLCKRGICWGVHDLCIVCWMRRNKRSVPVWAKRS